ncbi:hypothetical protein ACFL3G_10325 [Planctomycetota bacterium]
MDRNLMIFKSNRYFSDGKKVLPFWIFIAPIIISLVVGIPLVTKYPIPITILLVSFVIIIILASLCLLYEGVKIERYVQKHNFQLWKKSKSHLYRDRREASKEMKSLSTQIPHLERYSKYINRIAFTLLTIWTLIFIGIFSFIIFSAISG